MALPAAVADNRTFRALSPYEIRDVRSIETFLAARPNLVSLLEEAPARITAAFRIPHRLRLEVFRDFEAPDPPELHIVVVTSMTNEAEWDAADASVRCVYESWLKDLPRAETIDLFIRPEPR